MVLQAAYAAVSFVLPPKYFPHAIVAGIVLLIAHAFVRGRTTNRERDLHARVILVTGAFTPLGLTLISALAARGAHVIAVSPYPLEHAYPTVLIPLLRSTTKNPNIFADYADLSDPASIREFCTRFLTGADQRLDAVVFGHEYRGIGTLFGLGGAQSARTLEETQDAASLATFLIITLLLPALLVAPVERDIRIVSIVNPFYAAAAPSFTTSLSAPPPTASPLLREGHRAVRTVVFTRHLQRVLDSLPSAAESASSAGAGPRIPHPSNIIAASACPGISRKDTIAPLLGAAHGAAAEPHSRVGSLLSIFLFPVLVLFAKSPSAALQSVLHVLFLPTPFKRALAQVDASLNPEAPGDSQRERDTEERENTRPEEVLKPGALYRECAVVQLSVPPLPADVGEGNDEEKKGEKGKGKEKEKEKEDGGIVDDGELGGEAVGRAVWEWYEERLKAWEARAKAEAGEKEHVETTGSGGADVASAQEGNDESK